MILFMSDVGQMVSCSDNTAVVFMEHFCGISKWQCWGYMCSLAKGFANYTYKVHPATHCDIITDLSGQVLSLSSLKVRFGKFFKKCKEHKNMIVKAASTAAFVNPM